MFCLLGNLWHMAYLGVPGRALLSLLTAWLLAWYVTPKWIQVATQLQMGQMVRSQGPARHLSKAGTPTMGGVVILGVFMITVLLWGDLSTAFPWILIATAFGFGALGWVDDYRKIIRKNSQGLGGKTKLIGQCGLASIILVWLLRINPDATGIILPVVGHIIVLGIFLYMLLGYAVIVGCSNAVNLTDGLDGLALFPVITSGGALGVLAYVSGNLLLAKYFSFPYIPHLNEVAVAGAALAGAGIGFLWYNIYPASIFMGDVGSLGLGGVLGVMAILTKQELIFFIMGGVFVIETLSVILQVSYFKCTGGKRILRMAPLHHHLELKGWSEPQIIARFWIVTVLLVGCGLGLALLTVPL